MRGWRQRQEASAWSTDPDVVAADPPQQPESWATDTGFATASAGEAEHAHAWPDTGEAIDITDAPLTAPVLPPAGTRTLARTVRLALAVVAVVGLGGLATAGAGVFKSRKAAPVHTIGRAHTIAPLLGKPAKRHRAAAHHPRRRHKARRRHVAHRARKAAAATPAPVAASAPAPTAAAPQRVAARPAPTAAPRPAPKPAPKPVAAKPAPAPAPSQPAPSKPSGEPGRQPPGTP